MKTIHRADDGKEFDTEAACLAHEANAPVREAAERQRKVSEDFDFMVLCALKGNMGMYHLLRDTSLDGIKAPK